MFKEAKPSDYWHYFAIHVIASFFCFAGHNAFYYMFALNNWTFHYLHHATVSIVLLVRTPSKDQIQWLQFLPVAFCQAIASMSACFVHEGQVDGGLYTLRVGDVCVVALTFYLLPRMQLSGVPYRTVSRNRVITTLLIALLTSAGWMELELMHWQWSSLALPVCIGAQTVTCLLFFKTSNSTTCSLDASIFAVTSLVTALLFLPSCYHARSFFTSSEISSSFQLFEVQDLVTVFATLVSMAVMTYSRYWLIASVRPQTYRLLWTTKYALASVAIWVTHNMGTSSTLLVEARLLALAFSVAYQAESCRAVVDNALSR